MLDPGRHQRVIGWLHCTKINSRSAYVVRFYKRLGKCEAEKENIDTPKLIVFFAQWSASKLEFEALKTDDQIFAKIRLTSNQRFGSLLPLMLTLFVMAHQNIPQLYHQTFLAMFLKTFPKYPFFVSTVMKRSTCCLQ